MPPTQDGRKLRRYRRRWKIERLFAYLQNFRRLVIHYEYHAENFLGMVQFECISILLKFFLRSDSITLLEIYCIYVLKTIFQNKCFS